MEEVEEVEEARTALERTAHKKQTTMRSFWVKQGRSFFFVSYSKSIDVDIGSGFSCPF